MTPEEKKFIRENAHKMSAKAMASRLGIKERKVRRYCEEIDGGGAHPAPQAPTEPDRVNPAIVLFILLAVFAVYANALGGPFIFDDEVLVKNNVTIRSLSDVPKLFRSDLFLKDFTSKPVSNSFRPLQTTSYAIDYRIWKDKAFGYHLTNILLHLLSTLLVFILVRSIYPGVYAAYLAAAIFGVHPVNTACVTYISGRADIMVGAFILSSVIFRRYFNRNGKLSALAISAASYMLAVYSKEYAILVVPLLVIITDIFYGNFPSKVWSYIAYAIPLAAYLPMRMSALSGLTSVRLELSFMEPMARILTSLKTLFIDIRILLLPYDMHFGRTTKVERDIFSSPEAFLTVLGLAALAAAFVFAFRRFYARPTEAARGTLFGVAWFFLAMLPLVNIFPLQAFLADNWLYVSSIGIYLLMAIPFDRIYRLSIASHVFYRAAISAVVLALLSCYAYGTVERNRDYQDPIKFYLSNAVRRPTVKFYGAIAELYSRKQDYENSAKYARKAVLVNEIYPSKDVFKAYYNLGWACLKLGQYTESEKAFAKVVASDEYELKDNAAKALDYARRMMKNGAK